LVYINPDKDGKVVNVISMEIRCGMDVYSRNRTEMSYCPRVAENYDVLNKTSDFAIRKLGFVPVRISSVFFSIVSNFYPFSALISPVNPKLTLFQYIPGKYRTIHAHSKPVNTACPAYSYAAFYVAMKAELGF